MISRNIDKCYLVACVEFQTPLVSHNIINSIVVRGIGVPNYPNSLRGTISMSIYSNTNSHSCQIDFIPTWLYIKQHNITGLKYFGKTTEKDPHKYPGSGTYWKAHLNVYGNDVTTIWCHLFTDKKSLVNEALSFSKSHDIARSSEWANLIDENGLDGIGRPKGSTPWNKGIPQSDETKEKIRQKAIGRKQSPATIEKRKASTELAIKRGRKPHSIESFKKSGDTQRGKARPDVSALLTGRKQSDSHRQNVQKAKIAMGGTNKTSVTVFGVTYINKKSACLALDLSIYKLNKLLS